MPAITDYPAFVIAIVLFLAIPGPGNLAMLSSTAQGGIRGGLASTVGIIAGDQMLLWCAVAGVAALLKTYPAAFTTVQWLGAAYLAWMGLRLLTAKPGQGAVLKLKPSHFARQSFIITLLNPKAIVFYMAFFPLFIDPAGGPGFGTFAVMALTIAVLTFLYGLAAVLMTFHMAERIRANPQVSGGLQKLAGMAGLEGDCTAP